MKKKFFLFSILIILFSFITKAHAQSTYEVQFKTMRSIVDESLAEQYFDFFDYSVEIINNRADSADISYAANLLVQIITNKTCEQTKLMLKFLENKNSLPISDYETGLEEKLIYSILLFHTCDQYNNQGLERETAAKEILKNIIDKSSKKNYVMAALLIIAKLDYENYRQYYNMLREKFPEHKAWPYIEWDEVMVKYYYVERDYNKGVAETLKLAEKYKNLRTPLGEKYYIDCYSSVACTYAYGLGNYKKAEEYLAIIERDSPNYIVLDWLRKIVRPKAK